MDNATSSTQSASPAQALLAQELAHVARLQAERDANPILAGALQRVASWQGRRLRMTYEDLAAQARYADAILFFQTDLYGGGDFARRDADLARIVPMMVRMLPERVLAHRRQGGGAARAVADARPVAARAAAARRRPVQRRSSTARPIAGRASAPSASARSG